MYYEIGNKIKELRVEKNMTLKDLSEKTNLSSSFISQLERGMTTIAIDSLDNIAKVFNVPITYFFGNSSSELDKNVVLRKHERILLVADSTNSQYALSGDFESKKMFPSIYELNPSLNPESLELYSHRGEEFVYVTYGILTLRTATDTYYLYPGDTFHIDASMPHNVQNNTADIVQFLSVCIPDSGGPLVQTI